MRALMWFRADLRTRDNRALHATCTSADRGVVGVFAVCARQWQMHDWADIKVEFLLRNLACLHESLQRLNIPLCIIRVPTFDEVPAELLRLARRHHCDTLWFNREYEVNEQRRDNAVCAAFAEDDRQVYACDDQTILPPTAVETQAGHPYTVFTPFKRAWLARYADDGPVEPLPGPRPLSEALCASDPIPERVPGFVLSRGQPDRWPAGEQTALKKLSAFVDRRLRSYHQRRDIPAIDGTSALSPYLALGVLSPRQCLAEAAEANRNKLDTGAAGPTTWISELIWREFYRHVLVGYPRISMHRAFKSETEYVEWRDDDAGFEAWAAGRTGFPFIDAGMRELAATGWMHNRARMATAMFLTKDLLIDWRRGEQFFMQHLVDGDLASNNGGWQWSASTGTDAVPYFRIFNPFSQSKKYDPEGTYIRAWIPELRDLPPAALHDTDKLTAALESNSDYPAPIVDHAAARRRALDAFRRLSP